MGFKKNWDASNVSSQIRAMAATCTSPYNDGYTQWYAKQDLYQLKFVLDEALKQCPTFADEEQWLTEQEQKRIIKILKS